MTTEKKTDQIGGIVASAMWILYGSGILAVLFSIVSAAQRDYVGTGVCLIAAALAHGLLLNGLIRR